MSDGDLEMGLVDTLLLRSMAITCLFLFLCALLNVLLRRRGRQLVYRFAPPIFFTIFRSSLPLLLVIFLFVAPGVMALRQPGPFVSHDPSVYRLGVVIALALTLIGAVAFFARLFAKPGVFFWSRIGERLAADVGRTLGVVLRSLGCATVLAIVFCLILWTDRGMQTLLGAARILGIGFVLSIPLAAVFMEHLPRALIHGHLTLPDDGDDLLRLGRYRFVLILNGKNDPGSFSDLMDWTLWRANMRFVRPGVRALNVPPLTDSYEYIKAYMDYDGDLSPYAEYEDAASHQVFEEAGEELGRWVTRAMAGAVRPLERFELVFLDSVDLDVLARPQSDGLDVGHAFLRELDAVYLLVDRKTKSEDLELFHRLLDSKNTLSAGILNVDAKRFGGLDLRTSNTVDRTIVDLPGAKRSHIIEAVAKIETARVGALHARPNRVVELVEREIVGAELDELQAAFAREEIDETELAERQEVLFSEHGDALVKRNTAATLPPSARMPDAIALCTFDPTKPLIRAMVLENDQATRIYILFNILELLAKAMVFVRLLDLPEDHPHVARFPVGLTGTDRARRGSMDFADDVHYLASQFLDGDRGVARGNAATEALRARLTRPIALDTASDTQRLRFFFPFLRDEPIRSDAELLIHMSFLRNQIRGHGVVTNFLAAISYPVVLKYVAQICAAANDLDLHARRRDDGSVDLHVAGHELAARGFVRYHDGLDDFLFLEGHRKSTPVYIAYASGRKYRPSVVESIEADSGPPSRAS